MSQQVESAGEAQREATTRALASGGVSWLATASILGAAVAVFLAFTTRVWLLGAASLFYDEAFDILYATRPLSEMFWTLADQGLHPPLHYLWLHAWMALAGQTEFAARFASVIPGVLTVALAYATGREVFRRRLPSAALVVGVPSALLVACSPFLIAYSQQARMYSLATLMALLAVVTLLRATRERPSPFPHPPSSPSDGGGRGGEDRLFPPLSQNGRGGVREWLPWLWHALALAGMLYTLYYSAFIIPALFIYAAVSGWRVLVRWLGAAVLAAVLWLPWLPGALMQAQRLAQNPDYPAANLNPVEVVGRILDALLGVGQTWMLGALGLVALAGAAALIFSQWRRERSLAERLLLVTLAAAIPILLTGVAAALMPKFAARYAIVAMPVLFVAVPADLFAALWRPTRALRMVYVALIALPLIYMGAQAWGTTQAPAAAQEDARRAAQYLTERSREDYVIVLLEDAPYAFDYYYRGTSPVTGIHVEYNFQEGADKLNELLAKHPSRVWLALWHHEFADPTGMVIAELQRRSETPPMVRDNISGYTLMRFDLKDWSPVTAIPTPQEPIGVTFGDRLRLVGADSLDNGPGGLRWIFYWEALQPLGGDLSVAVQLVDANGKVALTRNQPPSAPWLATAAFPVGVPLRGLTQLEFPKNFAPGEYDVRVLVWDPAAQQNLPVMGQAGQALGEAVSLGRVRVTPEMLSAK
ncbi:MAG: glycosyltransferase family 39 protein [Anaerolineae bacterium]